jgi:hypothetical protein
MNGVNLKAGSTNNLIAHPALPPLRFACPVL